MIHCYSMHLPFGFGAHHWNLNEDRPILPAAEMLRRNSSLWGSYADIHGGSLDRGHQIGGIFCLVWRFVFILWCDCFLIVFWLAVADTVYSGESKWGGKCRDVFHEGKLLHCILFESIVYCNYFLCKIVFYYDLWLLWQKLCGYYGLQHYSNTVKISKSCLHKAVINHR